MCFPYKFTLHDFRTVFGVLILESPSRASYRGAVYGGTGAKSRAWRRKERFTRRKESDVEQTSEMKMLIGDLGTKEDRLSI